MAIVPFTLSGSVGLKGLNRPDDVSRVKTRLIERGFQGIVDFRDSAFNDLTGFYSYEQVEQNGAHGFGTDWLAEVIKEAGLHYRDDFMAQHKTAPLIQINDASKNKGENTKDHRGHETGLMCDIRLPRKDGGAGGIRVAHPLSAEYDRDAMRAMLKAFRKTGRVSEIILNDDVLIGEGLCRRDTAAATTKAGRVHDDHAHVRISIKARSATTIPAPFELTGDVGDVNSEGTNATADVTNVKQRLINLGFTWLNLAVTTVDEEFLDAIRLFQAIINDADRFRIKPAPGETEADIPTTRPAGVDGIVSKGGETWKWLVADNAPGWQQLPIGTVEVDDGTHGPDKTVLAIKLFQAIKNNSDVIAHEDNDGLVTKDKETHRWLNADNAPKWIRIPRGGQIGDGFRYVEQAVVPQPVQEWVTDWLFDVLKRAGSSYHENYLNVPVGGDSDEMLVEFVSTEFGGDLDSDDAHESGLTLFVRSPVYKSANLPGHTVGEPDIDAMRRMLQGFQAAGLAASQIRFKNSTLAGEGLCTEAGLATHMRVRVNPPARKKTGPGSIQLFPPKTQQNNDDFNGFGVHFLVASTGDASTKTINAIALTTAGLKDIPEGEPLGFQIPLKPESQHEVKVLETPTTANLGLKIAANQPAVDCSVFQLNGELDRKSWKLDVGPGIPVGGDFSLTDAELILDPANQKCRIDTTITSKSHVVPRPLHWSFDSSGVAAADGHFSGFKLTEPDRIAKQDVDFGPEPDESDPTLDSSEGVPEAAIVRDHFQLKFPANTKKSVLDFSIPVLLAGAIRSGTLAASFGHDHSIEAVLEGELPGNLGIDLGSPLARLSFALPGNPGGFGFKLGSETGFSLTLPQNPLPKLELDIFKKLESAVVNNVWSSGGDSNYLMSFVPPNGLTDLDEIARTLVWDGGFPKLSADLLQKLLDLASGNFVNEARQLQSLAGNVLGDALPMQVSFASGGAVKFNPAHPGIEANIKVLIKAADKSILEGEGLFRFVCDAADGGMIAMTPGSFSVQAEDVKLTTTKDFTSSFEDFVELNIPAKSSFYFHLDPSDPSLKYQSQPGTPKIHIQTPAGDTYEKQSRFIFDLDKLCIHSGGFDLKGGVRSESVEFSGQDKVPPSEESKGKDFRPFSEPLSVKAPERTGDGGNGDAQIGAIEFKNSLLVNGSVRASAKLGYFDDAVGTLTLAMAQDPATKRIQAMGAMDISGLSEFHIDPLYASCQLRNFQFGFNFDRGKWKFDAAISGRLKFAPPRGASAGELKELADLFKGVTCEFENLNPLHLNRADITVTFPAKRFNFAEVIQIDLRGVTIQQGGKNFKLLADAELKKLPGLDSSLRFGGIALKDGGSGPPSFSVDRIGASFRTAGGFELDGEMQFIELEEEAGFLGAFTLKTESLPRLAGLVKLTRVTALDKSGRVPSLAVFVEADVTAPLPAGFYLRSLGVGLGVFQALRGLQPSSDPLPKRISSFVNNPAGLPEPRRPDSWVPAPPNTAKNAIDHLNWMLVGSGLITLGKASNDKPHPIAGGILLAIDQDLRIVAGVNLWLFASPNDVRTTDFVARPVGRGAIGIAIREQRIFAMFQTVKNPKLRDDAPPILAEVLKSVETRLLLSADRDGLLVEVGWPWETKIGKHKLAGFIDGELISGFRFGVYRGVTTFGMNYGVNIEVEASKSISFGTRYGDAEASLSVSGRGEFRASFVGALTPDLKLYLLGDVRLAATVVLSARASASFRIKISRWIKISVSIRFSASVRISLSAALTAAIEPGPDMGFMGTAEVSISVSGYRLSGAVAFAHRPEIIDRTRQRIQELLPPDLAASAGLTQSLTETEGTITPANGWHYRYRVVGTGAKRRVRVLLFPKPGTAYPAPGVALDDVFDGDQDKLKNAKDKMAKRFKITLRDPELFLGFVGDEGRAEFIDGNQLVWGENPESLDTKLAEVPGLTLEQQKHIPTLRGLLSGISKTTEDQTETHFRNVKEISDPRVFQPTPDQTDDETATIARRDVPSPNIRRDAEYDQHLANAWTNDRNGATNFLVLDEDDRSFSVTAIVEELKIAAKRSADPQVALGIINENDKSETDGTPFYPLKLREWYRSKPTGDLPIWRETDFPIVVERTNAEEAAKLNVDALWRIDPNPKDAESAPDGLLVAQRGSRLTVLRDPNRYDGLDPAKILAELLGLLRDESDDVRPGATLNDEDRRWVGQLRLVMEFKDPTGGQAIGPRLVEELIDTSAKISIERIDLSGENYVASDKFPLESVIGLKALPEYDLVAGPVFQSNSQICLTWVLLREDPDEALAATPESSGNEISSRPHVTPFDTYEELERFVVTRLNLSRLGEEPIRREIYPAWIKTKDNQLIRPQFQFVDDELKDVPPGEQLQYLVEAEAPDRTLVSCLLNVIRTVLKPLPALGEALALNVLTMNGVDDRIDVCLHVDPEQFEKGLDRDEFAKQLKLLYRLVPAGTVGQYGFSTQSSPPSEWQGGAPARKGEAAFDIQFPSGDFARPLPWSDVEKDLDDWLKREALPEDERLKWEHEEIEVEGTDTEGAKCKRIVFTASFKASSLHDDLKNEWKSGKAIEFHIGREVDEPRRALERSPLVRCRHAILPRSKSVPGPKDDLGDLLRGNAVDALEYVPALQPLAEWLKRERVHTAVIHPDGNPSGRLEPVVEVVWQHDLSGRKGFDDPQSADPEIERFDPVVGYRLFRHDNYDPNPARLAPEQLIRSIPEAIYRAEPATIEVLGLSNEKVPETQTTRPKAVESLDDDITDRFKFGVVQRVADWIPFDGAVEDLGEFRRSRTRIPFKTFPTDADRSAERDRYVVLNRTEGQVLVHYELATILSKLRESLGSNVSFVIAGSPLMEVRARTGDEVETILRFVETLQADWTEKTDPYGWRALGALGLSLEVRFEDAVGRRISSADVLKAYNTLPESDTVPVSIAFFLAEDRETPLDVVRLVHSARLAAWDDEQRWMNLNGVLELAALGVPSKTETETTSDFAVVSGKKTVVVSSKPTLDFGAVIHSSRFTDWLTKLNARIWLDGSQASAADGNPTFVSRSSLALWYAGAIICKTGVFVHDPRPSQTQTSAAAPSMPRGEVALKISTTGEMRWHLPVPDRWAHEFEIGLGLTRRYDLARGGRQDLDQLPSQGSTIKVRVARTEPLVTHNLLATPLPGSIQALVFRHPAAFASAASAVQAAHIQYSGQTVILERQIDPDKRPWLINLYRKFVEKKVNWELYQTYLAPNHEQLTVLNTPELLNKSETNGMWRSSELALRPADIGLPAIYGADRYSYPDLPAYYQYRVIAYSTAGKSVSAPEATGWVSPLYTSEKTEFPKNDSPRQQPGILPKEFQIDDANSTFEDSSARLKLSVPLLHPRQHMPKNLRSLWVECDETLEVKRASDSDDTIPLKFGSLPDLYLGYQLYWIDGRVSGATKVFIPLLRVIPPEFTEPNAPLTWFQVETQTAGIKVPKGDTFVEGIAEAAVVQPPSGQLFFDIQIELTDPRCDALRSALQAARNSGKPISEIIRVTVVRDGVWSTLLPVETP